MSQGDGWEHRGNDVDHELSCELTAEELDARAHELASARLEYERVREAKKAAAKRFKSELDDLDADISRLAEVVDKGSERRMVPCSLWVDWEGGRMLTVRDDTREVISERTLEADERQPELFDGEPEAEPDPEDAGEDTDAETSAAAE